MLHRVDASLHTPATLHSNRSRTRTRSSGSSSGSSYDVPKTPVDAYSALGGEARLGQTFSVLKMKGRNQGSIGAYYRSAELYDEDGSSEVGASTLVQYFYCRLRGDFSDRICSTVFPQGASTKLAFKHTFQLTHARSSPYPPTRSCFASVSW